MTLHVDKNNSKTVRTKLFDKETGTPKHTKRIDPAAFRALRGSVNAIENNKTEPKPKNASDVAALHSAAAAAVIQPSITPITQVFGLLQTRPPGDTRTAKQIIDQDPALKNISEAGKESLKKTLGDYEKDPDKAYRASQVLGSIEKYDEHGDARRKKVARWLGPRHSGPALSSNGKIEGNKKDASTEAGLLKKFGTEGYKALPGGNDGAEPKFYALPLPGEKRPPSDTRSARQIMKENPALADLPKKAQSDLKQRVGDFEKDPDAAYRAERVITFVSNVDAKGNPIIKGNDNFNKNNRPDNEKLDGRYDITKNDLTTKKGLNDAQSTEAGRLAVFNKQGYTFLRGMDGMTEAEKASDFSSKALDKAISMAGGKPIKLSDSYYNGKTETEKDSNATAADKTATLVELQKIKAEYDEGMQAYGAGDPKDGKTADRIKFEEKLDKRIARLSADPEVVKFVEDKHTPAMREIIESDPQLKHEFERRMDAASSSETLEAAMNTKGADGKQISTAQALNLFVVNASFYGNALDKQPVLTPAFEGASASTKAKLTSEYDAVASGKNVGKMLQEGVSLISAIEVNNHAMSLFGLIMPAMTVEIAVSSYMEKVSDVLVKEEKSGTKIIITPEDVLKYEANMLKANQLASRIPNALNKVAPEKFALDNTAATRRGWMATNKAFLTGRMHGASAAAGAAALAASVTAGERDPTLIAGASSGIVGSAAGSAGFYSTFVKSPEIVASGDAARGAKYAKNGKDLVAAGRVASGIGGAMIAGYLFTNSVNAAKRGDSFTASVDATVGVFSLANAVGNVVDAAAHIAPRLGLATSSAWRLGAAGLASSVTGLALLGVTTIALVATAAHGKIKYENKVNKWEGDTQKRFDAVGLEGMPSWTIANNDPKRYQEGTS